MHLPQQADQNSLVEHLLCTTHIFGFWQQPLLHTGSRICAHMATELDGDMFVDRQHILTEMLTFESCHLGKNGRIQNAQ